MDKAEFVAEVARKASITRAEAARVVEAMFEGESGAISAVLQKTGKFSLPGFGTLTKKRLIAGDNLVEVGRASVSGKPLTGEAVPAVKGEKIIVFKHKRRKNYRKPAVPARATGGEPVPSGPSTDRRQTAPATDAETRGALAGIHELARKVWEDPADTKEFLTTPHGLLGGLTPLDAARSADGAAKVREILLALEYGLPV
jgi:hypothetical protein